MSAHRSVLIGRPPSLSLRRFRGGGFRALEHAVRESPPDLALTEQGDAEIAPNCKLLPVATQLHACAVDRTVSRVENRPILVGQPIALHAPDERDPQHGGILLFPFALRAEPLRWMLSWLREHPNDLALIDSVALGDPKPPLRITGAIRLFPQACNTWFCCSGRDRRQQ